MSGTDLHELSGAYAVDALDGRERERYEAHLAACPSCQAEVDDFHAAAARLAGSVEEVPPPSLKVDVLARIDTTRQERPASAGGGRWTGQGVGTPYRWAAAAAVVSVLVAIGAGVTLVRDSSTQDDGPTEVVLAARDAEMIRLEGPGAATANFHYAASEGRGVLSVQGLDPLEEGTVYELWIVRDEVPEPAGLFEPDAEGRATAVVADGFGDAAGVAVSVEPQGGVPAPTGPVIMEGTLPTAP